MIYGYFFYFSSVAEYSRRDGRLIAVIFFFKCENTCNLPVIVNIIIIGSLILYFQRLMPIFILLYKVSPLRYCSFVENWCAVIFVLFSIVLLCIHEVLYDSSSIIIVYRVQQ